MSAKHRKTVKELRETITHIRKKEFPYKKKEPKKINFAASILPPQLDKEQLKQRLMCASKCIELQIQKLDQVNDRFIQKERSIFTKLVDAYNHHEHFCGWELAETRRMCRLLMNARLALDQTLLRIQAVSNFDNVVTILGSCIGVIRSVSAGLAGVFLRLEVNSAALGTSLAD
jgi:division protein CdvB (Snf7/Vps24/ESCRT-III family)